MGAELLDGLNPPQREAVVCTDGPLLILAGAGSGKTRVLTHRVAYLISHAEVPPYRILAVTFTNKAAAEMKSRVAALAGSAARWVWVSTFHSFCARILREDIESLGYKRSFTILDESDQMTVIKRCLKQLNVSGDMFRPQSVLAAIGAAKNELVDAESFREGARDVRQRTIAQLYEAYQGVLARGNALDFDDLIMMTVRLFRERPEILEKYRNRFTHIMVDEYQDTNHAQYMLVKLLAAGTRNLCVVGDDDQSIYEWRGADIRNILEFERDYPEARVVKLEQNYRSTQTILEAANHVIANNRDRKSKRLWTAREQGARISLYSADTEKDEARFIADELDRLIVAEGRCYGDFAVLYRMNAQSRAIEEVLVNTGIPYRIVGGLKFYERREIKDVLAYLRVIENPEDSVSLERIINVPRRGIGDSTLSAARTLAQEKGMPLLAGVRMAAERTELAPRARAALAAFLATMERLWPLRGEKTVSQIVRAVLDDTGYLAELEKEQTIEAEGRIENLKELITVTQEFESRHSAQGTGADAKAETEALADVGPEGARLEVDASGPNDLAAFLEEVSLLTDLDRADLSTDQVTLMTLHSAKGLEFPVVFMAGMEENVFPLARSAYDPAALEEERRLCYVGITRAKDRLYLVHAFTRAIFGSSTANPVSRFVEEIPGHLLSDAFAERYRAYHGGRGNAPGRVGLGDGDGARPGAGKTVKVVSAVEKSWATRQMPGRPEFDAGDKIRHAKFGEGTVVSVQQAAGEWLATIAFPGAGVKQFVLSLAPIEKVRSV
jgi:DNA helicase-2/ATP-dependent DNA helicase PcrA